VDGFNPCSLWLISFLLGIVIYTRSRKKTLLVGLTFLVVTTAAYGLFMAGLLNVFSYIAYLNWIQIGVALIALIFALVNIKDYFWYKKGVSFTISDKYKPKIFKNVRNIMKGERSTWGMVVGTAGLALGVVLVELPCTAGFPVVWTNLLAQYQVTTPTFLLLLLLYLGIYMLDEMIVVGGAALTLKAGNFEEKHGRMLKLVGGVIMLSLAIVMLVDPEIMNRIETSLLIFGGSIAASFLIMLVHRRVLPRFGIKIGTEKDLAPEEEQTETDENKQENPK
jgi:cytochrome c biogenesis protein CcdA